MFLYVILTNFNFTHLWLVQILSIPKSLITAVQIIVILFQLSHKPTSVAHQQQQERQVLALPVPAAILEEKVSLASEHVVKTPFWFSSARTPNIFRSSNILPPLTIGEQRWGSVLCFVGFICLITWHKTNSLYFQNLNCMWEQMSKFLL